MPTADTLRVSEPELARISRALRRDPRGPGERGRARHQYEVSVRLSAIQDHLAVMIRDGGRGSLATREGPPIRTITGGLEMLRWKVVEIGGRPWVGSRYRVGRRVIAAPPVDGVAA
jgi:signal transduction histidine kinase